MTEDQVDLLQQAFERWWYNEASGTPPLPGHDMEGHAHRISRIAWHNGAYVNLYHTPSPRPLTGRSQMRPRIYPLLEEAIDIGVRRGWRLAHKHVEQPSEEVVLDRISEIVMAEILERFVIDDDSLS